METLALNIEIGALLRDTLGASMGGAIGQMARVGSALEGLERDASQIDSFRTLKKDTIAAEKEWQAAQARVKELAQEIRRCGVPTKEMVGNFDKAKAAAAEAKAKFESNRDSLAKLRKEMVAAGIDIQRLADHHRHLGKSINDLQERYRALESTKARVDANLADRSALQGQMVGATLLASTLAVPISRAIELESAMADVRKVVNFPTADGLSQMGETLKDMSREIPITAAGLAQITAAGGQLGVALPDLPDFTRTVATMATAFDMAPELAGDSMAKLANVYQIPIPRMASLGDAINHLSDGTASKARDMVETLGRIGGTARQFGLTEVQAAALSSTFLSLGQSPEVAGTAINALLMKLQTADKQSGDFQNALKAMGMDAKGLKDAITNDAQGALTGFLGSLAKVDGASRAGLISDLVGMEYADNISLVVGSLGEYDKALGMVADKQQYAGSMSREFENRTKTTENQLKLLRNGADVLSIQLGATLLPTINAVTGVLTSGAAALADWSAEHPQATQAIGFLVAGLLTLKLTTTSVALGWNYLKGAWLFGVQTVNMLQAGIAMANARLLIYNGTTLGAFLRTQVFSMVGIRGLAASLWATASSALPAVISGIYAMGAALLTNPVGIAATALAIGAALIIANWDKVGPWFKSLWGSIVDTFNRGVGSVMELLQPVLAAMGIVSAGIAGPAVAAPGLPSSQTTEVGSTVPGQSSPGNPLIDLSYDMAAMPGGLGDPASTTMTSTSTSSTAQQVSVVINVGGITVQATPGMDEKAIAQEVTRQLEAYQRRAEAEARGALYD